MAHAPDAPKAFAVRDLGRTAYREAHALQLELRARRIAGEIPDTLLLTEHEPVFTLGRSHPEPDLAVPRALVDAAGIVIVQVERGGDITYHGPGQLVAYGIVDLRARGLGVVDYVEGLEAAVITMAAEYGVAAGRRAGARGAWVEDRKLASIGVHVSRGVTIHGVAVNVNADLSPFDLINPCGMPGTRMTSLALELGREIPMDAARESFVRCFAAAFAAAFSAESRPAPHPVEAHTPA